MDAATIVSEILEKGNISLPRLAQLLETSPASISRWEKGAGTPSATQAERLLDLYRTLIRGDFTPLTEHAIVFASRGSRTRPHGQGVLGFSLSHPRLCGEAKAPIITQLMNGRVFSVEGERAILQLLEGHREPAETAKLPFEFGISAGKNTYTYDAHTYHTKVPPQGIAELLRYYLPHGGLVLDPFAGSGMTGVASLVLGIDCILNELSPAACFIANRLTSVVSPSEFEASVDTVLRELELLRRELYSTTCRECGRATELLYMVWSYRVVCNQCAHEFLLWDHCRKYGRTVREHKILTEFPCPSCGTLLKKSSLARTQAVPVMVGYKCCGSKQQEITHKPDEQDIQLLKLLEENASVAECFCPRNELPNGVNLGQPKRHGLTSVDKFYTRRNLTALSHLWQVIHRIDSPEIAGQLAFVFTSLYRRVTRLSEFRFWGGSGNTARFNVPYIFDEANVFVAFERKARTILDHLETTARNYRGRVVVVKNSATSLDYLPTDCVDLVFADPPFGGNINYSEMNFLWESWLGTFTDTDEEAVINRVQGKGVREYESLMRRSLSECFRVLRPCRWMLLVFMNSSKLVWEALRNSVEWAGFEIAKIQIFDKQHGTFKQFVSENTAGMDLVLHCFKPARTGAESLEHQARNIRLDVVGFLEARGRPLPVSAYLHVKRPDEIDVRTLYSEWLAHSLNEAKELMDFAAFRQIVERWLEGGEAK